MNIWKYFPFLIIRPLPLSFVMVSVKKSGDMQNNMWLSKDTSAFCYFTFFTILFHSFSKKCIFLAMSLFTYILLYNRAKVAHIRYIDWRPFCMLKASKLCSLAHRVHYGHLSFKLLKEFLAELHKINY